jgi:hypothetical protein
LLPFFVLPVRRRKWRALLNLLVLSAIAAAVIGCGGLNTIKAQGDPGTTAGSYTITVTGTSGQATATTAITASVM